MLRGGSGQPIQQLRLRDAGGGRDDDLMFGFAMDGLKCFMVALVTLLLCRPGPPWCTARHLVLWTGFPVLLPILLSVPATLTSPVAGKGTGNGCPPVPGFSFLASVSLSSFFC